MRYVISDCSNRSTHALHVSDPRYSMYSCEEGLQRFVCPGGRAGDKAIRDAESLEDLVRAYDEERGQTLLVALAESTGRPIDRSRPAPPVDDDEPDYEAILEERAEARAEEAIEAAERSYERYIYGE